MRTRHSIARNSHTRTLGAEEEHAKANSQTDSSLGDRLFNSAADFLFGSASAQGVPNDVLSQRERIAITAESYLGSTLFAYEARFEGTFGTYLPQDWKCNCFVAQVLTVSGINPPRYGSDGWPVKAQDWANIDFNIPGWRIVESPMRGDIAAFARYGELGHVGVVVGDGYLSRNVIGAGRDVVQFSSSHRLVRLGLGVFTKASTPVIYRRWVGGGD